MIWAESQEEGWDGRHSAHPACPPPQQWAELHHPHSHSGPQRPWDLTISIHRAGGRETKYSQEMPIPVLRGQLA